MRKWAVAILMILAVCVTLLPVQMYALAEGSSYDVSGNPAAFNLQASLTVKVDDEYVPSSQVTDPEQDQPFRLSLSWNLPTDGNFTTADTFEYRITEQILALNNITDGVIYGDDHVTIYGTYTVRNNVVTAQYNEALLAMANKYSGITIEGKVNVNVIDDGSEGDYHATIPGANDWEIQLRNSNGLQVEKTSITRADNAAHKVYQDYSITVTALEDNTNVSIVDKLYYREPGASGASWYDMNEGTIVLSAPRATLNGAPYTLPGAPTSSRNWKGSNPAYSTVMNISGITLNKDDVLIITYTVEHQECFYSTDNPYRDTELKNTVTVESKETKPVSDFEDITLKNSWVRKHGRSEGSNVVWTITVKLGEFGSITVNDTPDNPTSAATADDTVVKVYRSSVQNNSAGATQIAETTFGQLKSGYTVTRSAGDPEFVVLEFVTPATEGRVYSNVASLVAPSKSHQHQLSFGQVSATIGVKSRLSVEPLKPDSAVNDADHHKFLIKSLLDMTIGTDVLSMGDDFYFIDQPGEQQSNRHYLPEVLADCVSSV